jgi:hypothetical protein
MGLDSARPKKYENFYKQYHPEVSGATIPKYVGLVYIAELHLTISQHVDYPIYGDTLIRDYLNFNTTKS